MYRSVIAPEAGGRTEPQPVRRPPARIQRAARHVAAGLRPGLHLPIRLLEKLESDDYEGIDYSVYLKAT